MSVLVPVIVRISLKTHKLTFCFYTRVMRVVSRFSLGHRTAPGVLPAKLMARAWRLQVIHGLLGDRLLAFFQVEEGLLAVTVFLLQQWHFCSLSTVLRTFKSNVSVSRPVLAPSRSPANTYGIDGCCAILRNQ